MKQPFNIDTFSPAAVSQKSSSLWDMAKPVSLVALEEQLATFGSKPSTRPSAQPATKQVAEVVEDFWKKMEKLADCRVV